MRFIQLRKLVAYLSVMLLAPQILWAEAMDGSAATAWNESPGKGFENGTADGTAFRSPDGALVLDRGNILGSAANWSLLHPGQPSARAMACMVHDPVTNVSVLFGGNGVPNETWEYDCSANLWTAVKTNTAPSPRYAFGMAYEPRERVIVLFGGVTGGAYANDTWTYNAGAHIWTRMDPANRPSARYSCPMVYDPATGLMVLFGGYDRTGNKGDTWVYNLTADNWTERIPSPSPSPRIMHSMAFCPSSGVAVLFGGLGKGDLWLYNVSANAWTQDVAGAIPSPRSGALMVYDGTDDTMILFGGFGSGNYLKDTWHTPLHNPQDWAQIPAGSAPTGRDSAAGAYDPGARRLVIFGGQPSFAPGPPVGDTWSFNHSASQWAPMIPTARSSHAMASDERTGMVMLFGGRDNVDSYKNDTWVFDAGKNLWSSRLPADAPAPRNYPAMSWDAATGLFVLFGGYYPVMGDTWTYDPAENIWSRKAPAVSPSPRYFAAMANDPDNRASVLFGGSSGGSAQLGDTWAYDAGTDAWTKQAPAVSPQARNGHAMAYDRAGHILVLFGGINGSHLGDTWTFNLTDMTWKNVTPSLSPPPRLGHSMVYDSARARVILFGGRDGSGYLGDTWAYDSRQNLWNKLVTTAAPNPRGMLAAAYDDAHDVTILFGGSNGSYQGDAWSFPADSGFGEAGEFFSQPHDTGGGAYFGAISWNSTTPAGTAVRFRIRTANTSSELSPAKFSGPDGTQSSNYTFSGERIWSGHNGSRWVQYKAFLSTSDEKSTPVLGMVNISYNRMHKVTVYSPMGGEEIVGDFNITWTAMDPDGDGLNIDILLSRDGGMSYPVVLASGISPDFFIWNCSTQPPGSGCRIRVVARDDNAQIPLSAHAESGNFTIMRPNVLPTSELNHPQNGALMRTGPVTLQWNGSDGDNDALIYNIWMDGAVIARMIGTSFTLANLSQGVHKWVVIPNDGFGNGTCRSGIWGFTYTDNRPPVSELLSPAQGAILRTGAVKALWTTTDAENDLLSHHVLLNGSERGVTNGTGFTFEGLSNGSYSWSVIPADILGNGTCLSGAWNFTVRLNMAPGVSLLRPLNGSVSDNTTVELGWAGTDPDNDTLLYWINITDGAGFGSSYDSSSAGMTVTLQDNRTYSWNVTVTDGIATVTSPTFSFTVKANHRPGIISLPSLSAVAGTTYIYQVDAVDPDGDKINFSIARGPEGMTIDATGKVLWRPVASQAGKVFTVELAASDGRLDDRQAFVVRVLAQERTTVDNPIMPWILAAIVALVMATSVFIWSRARGKRHQGK